MNDDIRRLMGVAVPPKPMTAGPAVTAVPARMSTPASHTQTTRQVVTVGLGESSQAQQIAILEMELKLAKLKAGILTDSSNPNPNPTSSSNPDPNLNPSLIPTFRFEERTDIQPDTYEPDAAQPGSRAAVVNNSKFIAESPTADAFLGAAQPPPPTAPNLAAQSRAIHRFGPPRFAVDLPGSK